MFSLFKFDDSKPLSMFLEALTFLKPFAYISRFEDESVL